MPNIQIYLTDNEYLYLAQIRADKTVAQVARRFVGDRIRLEQQKASE